MKETARNCSGFTELICTVERYKLIEWFFVNQGKFGHIYGNKIRFILTPGFNSMLDCNVQSVRFNERCSSQVSGSSYI